MWAWTWDAELPTPAGEEQAAVQPWQPGPLQENESDARQPLPPPTDEERAASANRARAADVTFANIGELWDYLTQPGALKPSSMLACLSTN